MEVNENTLVILPLWTEKSLLLAEWQTSYPSITTITAKPTAWLTDWIPGLLLLLMMADDWKSDIWDVLHELPASEPSWSLDLVKVLTLRAPHTRQTPQAQDLLCVLSVHLSDAGQSMQHILHRDTHTETWKVGNIKLPQGGQEKLQICGSCDFFHAVLTLTWYTSLIDYLRIEQKKCSIKLSYRKVRGNISNHKKLKVLHLQQKNVWMSEKFIWGNKP